MAGIFTDAINHVASSLTALGLKPVTDPRNARPLTVFIELPSFESFGANPTSKVSDVTITIRILGAPPGNQDSSDYILQICDTILGSDIAVISGQPSIATIDLYDFQFDDLVLYADFKYRGLA
jgi:hypothetical protein